MTCEEVSLASVTGKSRSRTAKGGDETGNTRLDARVRQCEVPNKGGSALAASADGPPILAGAAQFIHNVGTTRSSEALMPNKKAVPGSPLTAIEDSAIS